MSVSSLSSLSRPPSSHSGHSTPLSGYMPNSPFSARSTQYALDLASDADTYSRKLKSAHPSARISDFAQWLRHTPASSASSTVPQSSTDDFRSRLHPAQRHMLSLGAAQPVIDELTASGQLDVVDELHARLRSVIDSPPQSTASSDRPPTYTESMRNASPPSYVSPLSTAGTRSIIGTADTASAPSTRSTNGLPSPAWRRRSFGSDSDRNGSGWQNWGRSRAQSPSLDDPGQASPRSRRWDDLYSASSRPSSLATPASLASPLTASGPQSMYEFPDTSLTRSSFPFRTASGSSSPAVELPTDPPDRAYELDANSQPSRYRQRQQYIDPSTSISSLSVPRAPLYGSSWRHDKSLTDHSRPSSSLRSGRNRLQRKCHSRSSRRKSLFGRLSRFFSSSRRSRSTVSSRPGSGCQSLYRSSRLSTTNRGATPSRRRLQRPPSSARSSVRSGPAISSLPHTPSTMSTAHTARTAHTTPPATGSSERLSSRINALTSSMNAHSRAQPSNNLLRLHAEHTRSPGRTANSLWTAHTADVVSSLDPNMLRRLASLSERAGQSGVTYDSMSGFATTGSVAPFYRGQERLGGFRRAWTEATRSEPSQGEGGVRAEDVGRLIGDLTAVEREMRRIRE